MSKKKVAVRRGRGLIAFMGEQEAITMMKGTPIQQAEDVSVYQERYAQAIEALKRSNSTISDPTITSIEPDHQSYLNQVSSTTVFRQAFQGSNWEFKTIEINNIACFQRHVDLEYVADLENSLPETPDPASVLRFCLPTTFPVQAGINVDAQATAITISSALPNLAITGLGLNQASQEAPPTVVFTLGVNANYVQVVKYRDRYILKNGYHRVYALKDKGIKTTPCVYSEITDFASSGAARPGFISQETLMSSRPPTVSDFFDGKISAEIKIQPTLNMIRIRAEQIPVPIPPNDAGFGVKI